MIIILWRGGIEWYSIPQHRKKNWQIPKYRVENRRNTDTAFRIGHVYLNLYPPSVFVYLKYVRSRNQPWSRLQENVRRPVFIGSRIEKPGHWMQQQFQKLCSYLPFKIPTSAIVIEADAFRRQEFFSWNFFFPLRRSLCDLS